MKKIVFILFLVGGSFYGQTVELSAIGISGGTFWAQNNWNPGYVLEVNLDMGEVLDFVFLQPTASFLYANKNEKINSIENELTLSHIIFGTKIIGYINKRPKGPYFGSAINYHLIYSEKTIPLELSSSAEIYSEHIQKVSMSFLTGYIQRFRRFSIFLEAQYSLIPGHFNTAIIAAGFLYNL